MTKVTLRKVNTPAGRRLESHELRVDGVVAGIVGRLHPEAKRFCFHSHVPAFDYLRQYFPLNKDTFKELV